MASALVAFPCLGYGQREVPLNPPPMAEPATVSVARGREVEIPLQASGRTPGIIRFLIRSAPADGSLGQIRPTGRNTAVVTYTHSGVAGAAADTFRFAAQAVDSPVSAAAEVRILIGDPPPRIECESLLDFGEVFAGESLERTLTLRNTGGSNAVVHALVKHPWTLAGPRKFQVPVGGTHDVSVVFSPATVGTSAGQLTFAGHPQATVTLRGQARGILAVSPEALLELPPTAEGSVQVRVKNLTDSERPLEVFPPAGLAMDSPKTVAANSEVVIHISRSAGNKVAVQGELKIRSGNYETSLPVRGGASPPMLRVLPAEGLNFGSLTPAEPVVRTFELINDGGTSARLEAEIPAGFVLVPNPSSVVIPPGGNRSFEISADRSRPGDFEEVLAITSPPGESVRIRLSGTVSAPPPPINRIPTRQLLALQDPTPGHPSTPDPADLEPPSDFLPVAGVPGELRLAWNEKGKRPAGYSVERRSIEFVSEGRPPRIQWTVWRGVSIQRTNGTVSATIRRVPPDSSWFVRVRAIDSEGRSSPPSATIRLASPPRPRTSWLPFVGGAIAIAACGLWASSRLRAWRATQEKAASGRIAKLEG